MNQEKIGNYICECRKKKNITQMELANKLLVSNRAVSKWEKGKSMPDVFLFNPLCEILGISVNELLAGESNNNDDKVTIEAIKYYNGKTKRRNYIMMSIIVMLIIVAFLGIYMFNNYNKCKIYSIDTKNEEFLVDGYLMLNQQNKILTINRLDYNFNDKSFWCKYYEGVECPDILAENLKIEVYKDEVMLKEIKAVDLNTDSRYLADIIKNVTIDLDDLGEDSVRNWDSEGYRIVIGYKVYKDNTVYDVNLDIELELSEIYANNKIFY